MAFGHAMEVRLSCQLRSGVPPFTPQNACLLLVFVGVFKALLPRSCNINYLFFFFFSLPLVVTEFLSCVSRLTVFVSNVSRLDIVIEIV